MPGKRFKAEEIVNKLRQADVELVTGVHEAPGTRGPDPILDLPGKLRRSEMMPGSPLDKQDVVAVIAEQSGSLVPDSWCLSPRCVCSRGPMDG
jgi:hypothetical protein